MQTWFAFYAVTGGASATLLGLLFVAVSMNAAAALSDGDGNSRRLAEQAFQNYLTVLLVSLLALFPTISLAEFGQSTLAMTSVSAVWVLVRLYLALTKPLDRETRLRSLRRHLLSLLGFALLMITSVRAIVDSRDHRSWFAAAVIILLASATTVSWELLIRIATAKPSLSDGRKR